MTASAQVWETAELYPKGMRCDNIANQPPTSDAQRALR